MASEDRPGRHLPKALPRVLQPAKWLPVELRVYVSERQRGEALALLHTVHSDVSVMDVVW